MKLNKVLGAYLMDKGQEISESSEPLCPMFLSELMQVFAKAEKMKLEKSNDKSITEQAAEKILEKRNEDIEECLACELMNMLGMPGDILEKPGEHISSTKPTIKIKIKKVSSSNDLDKILKEMKQGGIVDLNSANDRLGEIFDLNSIREIMETPMFLKGGTVSPEIIAKLKKLHPEITDPDVLAGRKPGPNGLYLNGDGTWGKPAKKKMEDGGNIVEETTLEEFLSE